MPDCSTPPLSDVGLRLSLAVVSSSTAPLLLLDGDLMVIAASDSFCEAFNIDPDSVTGRELFKLGAGEWGVPQLRSLMKTTVSGDADIEAYELDLKLPGRAVRSLVLKAHKLEYGADDPVRILLTVSDVTDARISEKLKDDVMRQNAILLQEVRHRVANSLQIIASVLMQSARKSQSDETRRHLNDAHHRVMSVAALERQLASSALGDVELKVYFTKLCETIGASMIRDHDQLSLTVTADETSVAADVSISLGLIVTELVINALKHAFPDGRRGKISVGYVSQSDDWTLSVTDNGIGIVTAPGAVKPGLGTSIVQALSKQLEARVVVSDADPGTRVSICHKELPGVRPADAARVADPAV